MRRARRADVDGVDVIAAEQIPRVGGHRRDVERPRGIAREVELRIRNGDDLAPRVALTAGQMRVTRPRAGAQGTPTRTLFAAAICR